MAEDINLPARLYLALMAILAQDPDRDSFRKYHGTVMEQNGSEQESEH